MGTSVQAKLQEQATVINQLMTQLNQLSDQNTQLHSQLTSSLELNRQLSETVQMLRAKLYGRKSEKTRGLLQGQLAFAELFDEVETLQDEPAEEPELYEQPSPAKTRKRKRTLREQFRNLPVEDVHYVMEESSKICPECGDRLTVVGTRQNRMEVQFIPAQVKLLRIMQETCSCPSCTKRTGRTVFVEPNIPEPVLQHSYASASSVAWAMYQKFVQAVPLYRQVKDWQGMGVDLSRGTLSNWIVKTCDEWLYPLIRYLEKALLSQKYLHADETPVQVLDEPGRKIRPSRTCGCLPARSEVRGPSGSSIMRRPDPARWRNSFFKTTVIILSPTTMLLTTVSTS